MTPATVSEARALGHKHGGDRVVIIQVNDDGRVAITTYGKDRSTCRALAAWADSDRALTLAAEIRDAG